MKASLKLGEGENQDPIFKSKIPIKILTLPFRSSIEASSKPKKLCFSFSSFWGWESGPLFKLNYRPNDPLKPFGFVLKTGVGSFGSPLGAPFTISVEYNFPVNCNNSSCNNTSPSFFINFKPRIGDFAIRRRVISEIQLPSNSLSSDLTPVSNTNQTGGVLESSDEASEKMTWSKLISGWGFEGLVGNEEVCARTAVPVMGWAAMNLRWGLRFPAVEGGWRWRGGWKKMPMPFLVLDKIGIEQIARGKAGREPNLPGKATGGGGDVAERCLGIKEELNVLRSENELLKKDFEKFFCLRLTRLNLRKNGNCNTYNK